MKNIISNKTHSLILLFVIGIVVIVEGVSSNVSSDITKTIKPSTYLITNDIGTVSIMDSATGECLSGVSFSQSNLIREGDTSNDVLTRLKFRNDSLMEINVAREFSDVVLTGQLFPVPSPYFTVTHHFYQIKPAEVIDGIYETNSLFVIIDEGLYWKGRPPEIKTSDLYMLFLQKINPDIALSFRIMNPPPTTDKALPENLTVYTVVGCYRGMIALTETASEQRAVQQVEKQFKVRIHDNSNAFVEAVKASVITVNDDNINKTKEEKTFSVDALEIYDALMLKKKSFTKINWFDQTNFDSFK